MRMRTPIHFICVCGLSPLPPLEREGGRAAEREWSFYVVHSTRTAAARLNIPAHENRLARPSGAAPPEAVLQSLETVEFSPKSARARARPSVARPPF